MSHRTHQLDYGLTSTPNTSVPGTPGSGSQDYAAEEVGEQCSVAVLLYSLLLHCIHFVIYD